MSRVHSACHASSAAVVRVSEGIITVRVCGTLASLRACEIRDALLKEIASSGTIVVVFDLADAEELSGPTGASISEIVNAAQMMYAETVITGLSLDDATHVAERHSVLHESRGAMAVPCPPDFSPETARPSSPWFPRSAM